MKREKKVMETACELLRLSQVHVRSPYYSEAYKRVNNILKRAIKGGCYVATKVELTLGQNRRVCNVSFDEAKIIAGYYEDYKEPLYTITFRFSNGQTKTVKHRELKEVERIREKGLLIEAIPE